MHVQCLYWLMSIGLLLQSAFSDLGNPQLVKWCQWRLQFCSGGLISYPLSAHVCLGLVVEYWPFIGAFGHLSHTKRYHCVILLLCFCLCHHSPLPRDPPTHPLIYTGPILMYSMKKLLAIISHYLRICWVSCTKANR